MPSWVLAGGGLTYLFHAELSEGIGWDVLFFPFWIFFSGSFAIGARYLVARLRGNQLLLALGAGALGALAGDTLMTLTLFRPSPPATGLRAPLVMTATLGALVAAGLAWAERKVPHGNPEAADTSSATDTTEQ